MEQKRLIFPNDQDNRMQKLYYDINIHTIFNRTKLIYLDPKLFGQKKTTLLEL